MYRSILASYSGTSLDIQDSHSLQHCMSKAGSVEISSWGSLGIRLDLSIATRYSVVCVCVCVYIYSQVISKTCVVYIDGQKRSIRYDYLKPTLQLSTYKTKFVGM